MIGALLSVLGVAGALLFVPVEQPMKFELVINLNTALTIPQSAPRG